MSTVYLIHFDRPLANDYASGVRRACLRYMGATGRASLDDRIAEHRGGKGSKILAELNRRGIGWTVVRTWADVEWRFESAQKQKKHGFAHLCPLCQPAYLAKRKEQRERAKQKQRREQSTAVQPGCG